jgi:two-component sensor histidine kinase
MYTWSRELAQRQLPLIRSDPWLRWVAGLSTFALTFALRWVLDGILPIGSAYYFFFTFAILVATLLGGAVVGLTVLGLSFVSAWYFFVPPAYSFELDRSDALALVQFALIGMAIVAVAHGLNVTVEHLVAERKRSEELLQKSTHAEEKLAELNRELLHRIRNDFMLAVSIAEQISRYTTSPAEMVDELTKKFRALAVAQELLVANELAGADLLRLASETLTPLAPDKARLTLTGPSLQLSPETTTSLALVLHELATNAAKYGAWSNDRGIVDLEWSLARAGDQPVVTLHWREKGGPACKLPSKSGQGTLLIDNVVTGAIVKRQFLPEGLPCSMQFAETSA